MRNFAKIGLVLLLTVAGTAAAQTAPQKTDQCRACHMQLDDRLGNPAKQFGDDIHALRELSCADCHGGDASTDDMEKSMSRQAGFRGVPRREEIPRLCARCHSDGAYMRAYNPSLRTDQHAQYLTSVHGKRLMAGDTRVAVCSDCHGAHSIRPATSPVSSVYPGNIPDTCGRCHSNAEYMKPYKIPTDQVESYRRSQHYATLRGGDLAAPHCATCHGNHGAAPPGVASVERVCGTCHLFQQQLFDQSPHKRAWEASGAASCTTCHSNHQIEKTRDSLISTGADSFCARCHAEGDAGWKTAATIYTVLTGLDADLSRAAAMLERAERVGMEVSEAKLTLSSGREQLIKARVDIHGLDATRVKTTADEGSKLARQALEAGEKALAEYDYRRKGLALSLVVIAFVVLALWLYIRNLESAQAARQAPQDSRGDSG